MKTKLFLFTFLTTLLVFAQEKTVNLSLGGGYANQIYYHLNSESSTSFDKNSWDIAFLRISNFDQGMRVNDGIGIEVYEAANNASEWDNIDVNNTTNWVKLYNSDKERKEGAFMQGSATYGWGEYNVTTHTVNGTIVFVLKYTADDTYKKFICESYSGGYTIKYASWDSNSSTWGEDKTATVVNANNVNHNYNYFSLQSDQEVVAEPEALNWDFVFTKYYTDVPDGQGGTTKYLVTGVLTSDNVTVAKGTDNDTSNLSYSSEINMIGYDWKDLNASWQWDIFSDQKFYIKYADGTIYKMYFTDFEGSSTGNLEFKFEDVTQALSIENVGENIAFGVYPNPVNSDRKINIIYDINKTTATKSVIEIYNVSGKQVLKTEILNSEGFYNKEIDLGDLRSGIYLMRFDSGNYQKTRKIVLK